MIIVIIAAIIIIITILAIVSLSTIIVDPCPTGCPGRRPRAKGSTPRCP